MAIDLHRLLLRRPTLFDLRLILCERHVAQLARGCEHVVILALVFFVVVARVLETSN